MNQQIEKNLNQTSSDPGSTVTGPRSGEMCWGGNWVFVHGYRSTHWSDSSPCARLFILDLLHFTRFY